MGKGYQNLRTVILNFRPGNIGEPRGSYIMFKPQELRMIRRLFLALPWLAAAAENDPLADARRRIDAVDQRIVSLLNERAAIVDEIAHIKKARHIPVNDP